LVLGVSLGFAQAGNPIARLPLAAFLEQLKALKAFKDVSFAAQSGGCSQTPML
jgi:hypothetical protein